MKVFLNIGKAAGVLFWGVVLANLAGPFAQPFDLLLHMAGGSLLALHIVELMLFRARWQAQPSAPLHALQILLFGMFHLLSLPAAQAVEAVEEPVAEPVQANALEVEHA